MNQAGPPDTEAGAKVLPFRGEWLGSVEELVPFGPRACVEEVRSGSDRAAVDPPAAGDAASEPAKPADAPHVVAEDFWAGLAEAGDLIQFPAAAAAATAPVGPSVTTAHRSHSPWLAVAAAALAFAVIGLRLSGGSGASTLGPAAALAQSALSIANLPVDGSAVDQQHMRQIPLRVPVSTHTRNGLTHVSRHSARKVSRRVLVSQSGSSPVHSQPAVYSKPVPPRTSSPPVPGPGSSGSGGGSGGRRSGGGGGGSRGGRRGGGGSSGGRSGRSGPSGRGAAFGPGKMGG